jgi:hypothetical protein
MSSIKTLPDLIEATGGPTKLAKVLRTTPQNITNWQAKGYIPSAYYMAHSEMLEAKGFRAKHKIWGFRDPPQGMKP